VLPVVIGVAVVVVAVLGTGLGWPGWMLTAGGGASVAADRSTPDSTARAVVDALNRRDVDQFVGQLVCADGRSMSDDGSTTLAEETLYRDIAALDPDADAEIANANPHFQLDEIRQIKPSDPSFSEDMADAQVAVVSVTYPDIPDALRAELPDLQGMLTLVNEDNAWVVCQMGFLPAGEVPGQVAADPDPTSPTGRAQGFIGAVNAGDQGTARVFMCSTAYPVDEFAAAAIAEGAQLRLNQRVEPMGSNAQVQIWYTANGQERRASGIMGQEQDGWCVQALALLAE
jgi:hypothetical protein